MQLQSSEVSRLVRERGVILVLAPFILALLLFAGGVLPKIGTIYLQKARLSGDAKAAALAAGQWAANQLEHGKMPSDMAIAERFAKVINANLVLAAVPGSVLVSNDAKAGSKQITFDYDLAYPLDTNFGFLMPGFLSKQSSSDPANQGGGGEEESQDSDYQQGNTQTPPEVKLQGHITGPAYYALGSSAPIVLVVAFDMSLSISKKEMDAFRAAAIAVAQMLSAKDYFGLVAFNHTFNQDKQNYDSNGNVLADKNKGKTNTPVKLQLVTQQNMPAIIDGITHLKQFGPSGTYGEGGLSLATQWIASLKDQLGPAGFGAAKKVVLLLSDGLLNNSSKDLTVLEEVPKCGSDDLPEIQLGRARSIRIADTARKELGIEFVAACPNSASYACGPIQNDEKDDGPGSGNRQTLKRLAAHTAAKGPGNMYYPWTGSSQPAKGGYKYWDITPNPSKPCSHGYDGEPVPAIGLVKQRYNLVSYKAQDKDAQYIVDAFKNVVKEVKGTVSGVLLAESSE